MKKIWILIVVTVAILFFANLLVLDWRVLRSGGGKWEVGREVRERSEENEEGSNKLALENRIATDSCGIICQETIEEKIKEELAKIPSPAGQSSVSPFTQKSVVQPTSVQSRVVYVPLITEGTASSISWTDIIPSEFYFDLKDYSGAKEVRFQAYLLSANNDLGFARLYDVTNSRGVDFSDLQTTSSTFTRVESSGMKIWQGNNKYTLQLRSVNGTQAQLKDAKLKIIY